jgi:hypothetical protein
MKPNVFRGLAAVVCAVSTAACGGELAGEATISNQDSSLEALESGATVERTYLGVTQNIETGPAPVVGTFDLLGGADVDLEIVAKNGAPLEFELWQVHVDKWATLDFTVDEASGFALHELHTDEDSSWLLRFPAGAATDVVVSITCEDSTHGCTPLLQPGQLCPIGWPCDEGLVCKVPGDVCAVAP